VTIESQMQGGVIFGITQLVPRGAITLKDGRVEQRNWDGYTPPYIKDAPITGGCSHSSRTSWKAETSRKWWYTEGTL
jgi:hypothetical protein